MDYLSRGYRLCRPSYWRDTDVWIIIIETWNTDPSTRPSFLKLYEFFKIKHMQYAKYESEHDPIPTGQFSNDIIFFYFFFLILYFIFCNIFFFLKFIFLILIFWNSCFWNLFFFENLFFEIYFFLKIKKQ